MVTSGANTEVMWARRLTQLSRQLTDLKRTGQYSVDSSWRA